MAFFWTRVNKLHDGKGRPSGGGEPPDGLKELEESASALALSQTDHRARPSDPALKRFRRAQQKLWVGLRKQGNPWRITDFVTVGTPMYFAHRLYTKNRRKFEERIGRRELPTCPPLPDQDSLNNIHRMTLWYSWNNHGRRVVYEGAPFAVIRWTNLWFPTALSFFGDWFGGPLAPLFGKGICDVELVRNRPWRWVPGYAHSLYFRLRRDTRDGALACELRRAIGLPATTWLRQTLAAPDPDPRTAGTIAGDELLPPRHGSLYELWKELRLRLTGSSYGEGP
jgi:hypothetical protein